jgi:hypothetical protein
MARLGSRMGLDSRGMGSTWVTANIFDRMLRWVPQERSALTQQALNNAYLKLFVDFGQGRKFYVTEKGRMGMVPDVVKKGDEIYLFSGWFLWCSARLPMGLPWSPTAIFMGSWMVNCICKKMALKLCTWFSLPSACRLLKHQDLSLELIGT